MKGDLTPGPPYGGERNASVSYSQSHYDVTQRWLERAESDRETTNRTGWWVACVLFVICAAQAAAIAVMLPLKEVVPYTILVDRQTGYLETVRGLELGEIPQDEAITQSFLAQYVLARETYDPVDLAERYERVALWSDGDARTSYIDAYRADNPSSLPLTLPHGARTEITVKSIEILSNNSARVRFEARTHRPAEEVARVDYQAVIGFRYSNAAMRTEDRLINPLGFQAITYRRDAETTDPIGAEPTTPPTTDQPPEAPQPTQVATPQDASQ